MPARSEKEAMLAGERYNCLDPALAAERRQASAILRRFNLAEDEEQRAAALRELLGQVGAQSLIEPPFHCSYGANLYLGDYVYLNAGCTILDNNAVRIGDHAMIGPAVQIYTAAHPLQAQPRIEGWEVAKPIVIEENVWIAGGAIILPGVRIGRNAVVGAGAVVTRDVPRHAVVAGNPARVMRMVDERPLA